MYIYIFQNPLKIMALPNAPLKGHPWTTHAQAILSFHPRFGRFAMIKNRDGLSIDQLAKKYLGVRLFDDGFFISDKDLMIFTLKYSNLQEIKELDFPII